MIKSLKNLEGVKNIEELIQDIINSRRKENIRLIHYLRLYTDITSAYEDLYVKHRDQAIYYLNKAKRSGKDFDIKKEEKFMEKIIPMIEESIVLIKKAKRKKKKPSIHQMHRVKANLLTIQGICVIRMLKRS